MNQALHRSLNLLSQARPCFHSEADFQFALAWQIKQVDPSAVIRLEKPVYIGKRRMSLDIYMVMEGSRIAIELKYFKAPLVATIGNEVFELPDAVAHDLNRYDFLKDVQRLERLLGRGVVEEAYVIALTNQPKYWSPASRSRTVDEQFQLHEGRMLYGEMLWAPHTGGTMKGREKPIHFEGSYPLVWQDYSRLPDLKFGLFRYLCVEAVPAIPKEGAAEVFFARMSPAPESRRSYGNLADSLLTHPVDEMEMSFSEIEALTGDLPPSARRHSAWWGNHHGNSQAVWVRVGWRVKVDLEKERAVFRKSD